MSRYILQRLLGMLVVMFVVVTIVFIIVRVAPGDPAAVMLGPDATRAGHGEPARAARPRPAAPVQYVLFLGQLAQGDLGQSIFLNRPVLQALAERAEPTFFLTMFSILIAATIALPDRHLFGLPARLALRPGGDDAGDAGGLRAELLARPPADPVLRRAPRALPGLRLRRARRRAS